MRNSSGRCWREHYLTIAHQGSDQNAFFFFCPFFSLHGARSDHQSEGRGSRARRGHLESGLRPHRDGHGKGTAPPGSPEETLPPPRLTRRARTADGFHTHAVPLSVQAGALTHRNAVVQRRRIFFTPPKRFINSLFYSFYDKLPERV